MTDNNKKILEEFYRLFTHPANKAIWLLISTESVAAFFLEKLQEERMRERAKHRDAGCKCGECQQDNINIQYNRLKSEEKA